MKKWETKKTSIILLASILIMLTLFYFVCDFTLSWLYANSTVQNTGSSKTASASAGLSTTSSTFEVTLGATGSTLTTTTNSTVTNKGTTNAILRCYYAIIMDESTKQIATTRHLQSVTINNGFLASDENIENTYSGYYYYNSVLAPNASVSLINHITPTAEGANKKVKIRIIAEMVDYTGGVYHLGSRDPWDNTPAGWFANNFTISKAATEVVGPKLAIKWEDISKIEMTASTTSASQNIFFCTYNNAWIGINASGKWQFNKLDVETDLPESTFTNGAMHTVTFTIKSVDSTAKNQSYIGLIWDETWSKDVKYASIKIYDKNGDYLCYLTPDKSGKFYDRVSKTILPMYSWSGATSSTSSTVYGASKHLEPIDGSFESYATGETTILSNQTNGTLSIIDTDSYDGAKCLKVSASDTANNYRVFKTVVGKKGKAYRFSFAYKSAMPAGTSTGQTADGNYVVAKVELQGGNYSWTAVRPSNSSGTYSGSGQWEIMTLTTPVLTSDTTMYCFVHIPLNYDVFIDAYYIEEV